MAMGPPVRERVSGGLALCLGLWTLWCHGLVLRAGLHSDDYVKLRRWTVSDVSSALTGSWDPAGFIDPYHRPLTALYESALRPVFGLHPTLLHAWLLSLTFIAALGLFAFAAREAGRRAGILAAFLFIAHPMLAPSTSAWISNGVHVLADLAAIASLLIWQRARTRPLGAWWPLAVLTVIAFWLKEDGLMIVPALLALQWLRQRMVGDAKPVTLRLTMAAVMVAAALIGLRLSIFPFAAAATRDLDAYHVHEWSSSVYHVMAALPGGVWGSVAGAIVTVIAIAAIIVALRAHSHVSGFRLTVTGLVLMVCFSAPLVFIGGPTRSHLITLAAAIVMAGVCEIVLAAADDTAWERIAYGVVAAALVFMSFGARVSNEAFLPCSAEVLDGDRHMAEWPGLSDDLRRWLTEKYFACQSGEVIRPLPEKLVIDR